MRRQIWHAHRRLYVRPSADGQQETNGEEGDVDEEELKGGGGESDARVRREQTWYRWEANGTKERNKERKKKKERKKEGKKERKKERKKEFVRDELLGVGFHENRIE